MTANGGGPRPWFPVDVQAWPEVVLLLERLGEEWPEALASTDLRYHADRVKMGRRKKMPGRRYFAKRWGWDDWRTRKLMASGTWQDPAILPLHSHPTPGPLPDETRKSPETQDADSRSAPTPLPLDSTGAEYTGHRTQDTTEQQESAKADSPPEPGTLLPEEQPEKPTPTQQAKALWDEWEPKRAEAYQGRATKKLPKSFRTAIVARIREHSVEDVERVIEWWLYSDHERAMFLRSRGCGWKTLTQASNFNEYLGMCNAMPAPMASAPQATPTPDDTSNTSRAYLWAMRNRDQLRDVWRKATGEDRWGQVEAWLAGRVSDPDKVVEQVRAMGKEGVAK